MLWHLRSRTAVIALAGAFVGAGFAAWIMQDDRARIELRVADKQMVAGQQFDVEVVPNVPVCFDGAYRLMLRADDRWVATHDLGAPDPPGGPPYIGPVEGDEADEFSGCESGRVTHRLRLPPDARPGRYRLKKWFSLSSDEAQELLDQGKNGDSCCLDIQWWVDFDVRAR